MIYCKLAIPLEILKCIYKYSLKDVYLNIKNTFRIFLTTVFERTVILIHRKFIHYFVHIHTTSIENTTINTKINNQKLGLSVVYKRRLFSLKIGDIHSLLDSPIKTIITGDLNAKHYSWNSLNSNRSGKFCLST